MTPTPLEMWDQTARGQKMRKKVAGRKMRQAALSKPITFEQIIHHSQFLEVVPYAGGFCWLYTAKATGGRTGEYTKLKLNGYRINAHRFALALKLGCTLWDLEGVQSGHHLVSTCMGGRCRNHVHLRKVTGRRNAWDRAADREEIGTKFKRTKAQKQALIRFMYPKGVPTGQRLLIGRTLVIREGRRTFTIRVD